MTKRKTTSKQAPQAPVEAVEDVKQESNTKVASKPKQAKTTAKKASTGGRRGRPRRSHPGAPSDEGVPEHLPPARAGLAGVPRPAACLRLLRGRGAHRRAVLRGPRGHGPHGALPHA